MVSRSRVVDKGEFVISYRPPPFRVSWRPVVKHLPPLIELPAPENGVQMVGQLIGLALLW